MFSFVRGRRRNYAVVFGMDDTGNSNGRIVVPISQKTMHPSYNSNTMSNDIAILEFSGLTLDDLSGTHAQPACLASRDYTDGEMAVVSGWGTTSEGMLYWASTRENLSSGSYPHHSTQLQRLARKLKFPLYEVLI